MDTTTSNNGDCCRYAVTLLTHGQRCFLASAYFRGNKSNPACPNSVGKMVLSAWQAMPKDFARIGLDTVYLLPNSLCSVVTISALPEGDAQALRLLRSAVQRFKLDTTRSYNHASTQDYHSRLWQPAFQCKTIVNADEIAALKAQMAAKSAYQLF